MKYKYGYTIIELAFVISILAIISIFFYPTYSSSKSDKIDPKNVYSLDTEIRGKKLKLRLRKNGNIEINKELVVVFYSNMTLECPIVFNMKDNTGEYYKVDKGSIFFKGITDSSGEMFFSIGEVVALNDNFDKLQVSVFFYDQKKTLEVPISPTYFIVKDEKVVRSVDYIHRNYSQVIESTTAGTNMLYPEASRKGYSISSSIHLPKSTRNVSVKFDLDFYNNKLPSYLAPAKVGIRFYDKENNKVKQRYVDYFDPTPDITINEPITDNIVSMKFFMIVEHPYDNGFYFYHWPVKYTISKFSCEDFLSENDINDEFLSL